MATKTNRFNISTEFLPVALLVLFILCPGLAWAQTPFYQRPSPSFKAAIPAALEICE
jgi:hypothetical protein